MGLMPDEPVQPSRTSLRARLGPIALGVAVAAAVAAGFWVFNSDDGDPAPASDMTALPGGPTAISGTGPLVPDRPEAGKLAPDFALADARDPTKVRALSEFFGTPIVLNWYASWCEPCREEIPAFVAAQTALGNAVQFVGVDWLEGAGAALTLFDEFGANYPALLDRDGRIYDRWRNTGVPTTYFIDAGGILRAAHAGPLSVEQLVDKLATIGVTYIPAAGGG